MTTLKIKKLQHFKDLPLPKYETPGSAGLDLMACIDENLIIKPQEFKLIPTGISIALEEGFEAQVRPRSGLALKNGITVLNSPGTIDSDYRGEICVILINHSKIDFIKFAIDNGYIKNTTLICWSDFGYYNSILHNNPEEFPQAHLDITRLNLDKINFFKT